ncbi:class I SAM-dependent methyltransferase [Candidatus Puniceispirillum sp.]|nr:class I SAM-dependent methyltransferase [Candidatus Puniceispirillum sp.]
MCKWTEKEFSEQVYNEEYLSVDPDYVVKRPVNSFNLLEKLFPINTHSINHLDYGGGNGYLSKLLREHGWKSKSFDPFLDNKMSIKKLGKFNLITAFEVFEHVPNTDLLLKNLSKLMHLDSVIIFSTLVSDGHIKLNGRLDWWYASPRNGHISLYSKASLTKLASKFELKFGSFNENVHCFVKQVPSWASHLF